MPNQDFNIQVSGDLLKRLPQLAGAGIVTRLAKILDEQNEYTVSHIQQKYMSFPKDQPPTMDGLRVQSNRLRDSINASEPEISGGKIDSGIGSNVVYARIQEVGGQTSAHDIVARNADALAFIPGGGKFFSAEAMMAAIKGTRGNARKNARSAYIDAQGIIFRKRVHHPGSDMPARQYVQRGIEDRLNDYTQAFNQEIQRTISS